MSQLRGVVRTNAELLGTFCIRIVQLIFLKYLLLTDVDKASKSHFILDTRKISLYKRLIDSLGKF